MHTPVGWVLLHYNTATGTKTTVQGIVVHEMLDFAMVETPGQLRACVLTNENGLARAALEQYHSTGHEGVE